MTESLFPPVMFLVVLMLFSGGAYVFGAYVVYRVGRKFGVGSFPEYLIPVYNFVLLCRCAEISPWLLLWFLVPLANLGFLVYVWGTVASKLGRDFWLYGLGTLLFGVPALVLAFDDSHPPSKEPPFTRPEPSILCVAGEFTGSRLPIGLSGLIIGRSAEKSNVILSSLEISAAHAKVWSDVDGRIWVEDMSSSNGTYYCRPRPGDVSEWIQINKAVALASGTRFRLGEDVAEFVVS